ncbi:MAG: hypothetical protein AAFR20_11820 [Pseudomonadota bacterium]
MTFLRIIFGYILAVIVAVLAASTFYSHQVLAKQEAIGVEFTGAQRLQAYTDNLIGLAPSYGGVVAIGLLIAFPVAAGLKRVLKPLAAIAYPAAGAAALFTVVWSIENLMAGGGTGAIGGARDAVGMGLQAVAGALGGLTFALVSGGWRR